MNNRRKILFIGFVAAGIALMQLRPLFLANRTKSDDTDLKITLPVPGKRLPAPDFVLPDLNGKSLRLSDFRGTVVFLGFWTSW